MQNNALHVDFYNLWYKILDFLKNKYPHTHVDNFIN